MNDDISNIKLNENNRVMSSYSSQVELAGINKKNKI